MVTRVTPLEFYTVIVVSRNPIHYLIPNMAIYHSPCILCSHYFYGLLHPPPSMCSLLCFSFYRALCPNISLPLTLLTPSVPSSVFSKSPLDPPECASASPYILDAKHATLTIMSSCPMRRTASLPAPVGWGLNSSVSRFHPLSGASIGGTRSPGDTGPSPQSHLFN